MVYDTYLCMIRLESLRLYHPVLSSLALWFTRIVHVQSDIIHGHQYIVSAWRCLHSLSVSLHYTTLTRCILHILHLCYVLRGARPLKFNQFWGILRKIFPNYGYLVWYFMHSWCIVIFAILWRHADSLIVTAFGLIRLLKYILERYCTSAVYTCILPSPTFTRMPFTLCMP